MASWKNYVRYTFMVINGLLWITSLVLLCLMAHYVESLTQLNLIFGTTVATMLFFIQGSFVFSIGFLGCFVSTTLNRNVIKMYLTLTSMLIVTDILFIVFLVNRHNQMNNFWMNTAETIRNDYQLQNECCGFSEASSDYGSKVPLSCYNTTVIGNATYYTPWVDSCSSKLGDNFGTSLLKILLAIEIVVMLANIVGNISGAFLFKKLVKRRETKKNKKSSSASSKPKAKQNYRFVRGPIKLSTLDEN